MTDYYDERIETMPRADIRALQEAAILRLVPYAYERAPLIRAVWEKAGVRPSDIRSLEHFRQKAPFIDKDALRQWRDAHADPFGGLRCKGPPAMRGVGFTSGTTGDPTAMPFSDQIASNRQLRRDLWQIGMRPGDHFIFNILAVKRGQEADRFSDIDFRPICFGHDVAALPYIIEACERYRPKVIHQLSRPLINGLEQLALRGEVDLKSAFSSVQGAVFGGEPPSPRVVSLLKSWGLELFDLTALGDVCAAMDCRAHDGMHAWEDLAFVECLDPESAEPVPEGQPGELVVTALFDEIAPLIRYRSGDLVTYTSDRCSCGRTHGRVKVLGRIGDQVVVEGKTIMPRDLMPIFDQIDEVPGGLFQIIRPRRDLDVLALRVGAHDPSSGLSSKIADHVSSATGVGVTVEIVPEADLLKLGPPHKIPRVTKS